MELTDKEEKALEIGKKLISSGRVTL